VSQLLDRVQLAHVGRLTVEAAREIRGDRLEVLGGRLDKIDDRHLIEVSRLQLGGGMAMHIHQGSCGALFRYSNVL
jgi:hypothetical protein